MKFFTRLPHLRKYVRPYYTVKNQITKTSENVVAKHIQQRIKFSGPITVAHYMREVLTNPHGGYYMSNDVIGETGDFITSPELSQLFGEMIAIWFLNEWSKAGSPKPFQIVELGPGKGSLCQDILRVFDHFQSLKEANIQLVEVSPLLSDMQSRKLCINTKNVLEDEGISHYKEGISHFGVPVYWHKHLSSVPNKFTLFIAHEFFDALPIHKFVKSERGFREILIDNGSEENYQFRYVVAKEDTPASKVLIGKNEKREHFEISPESILTIKEIAKRIEIDGGMALVADYGHDGDGTDTFRAYKKHKQENPLIDAGTADLTADVDFNILKNAALENDVLVYGPVTQREFLLRMGITERVNVLKEKADEKQKESMDFSYHMMVDADKMGIRFKLLSILPASLAKILEKYPPVGFKD